jgi:hypothetical protein
MIFILSTQHSAISQPSAVSFLVPQRSNFSEGRLPREAEKLKAEC